MRDILLMGLTAALCLTSVMNSRIGLYGYYWFALMRPDILAYSGANRYSMFMALTAILTGIPRALNNLTVLVRNPLCRTLLILLVPITLSVFLALDTSLCWAQFDLFLRMTMMALMIPLLIQTEMDLKILVVVMAGSVGLLGAKFGLYGVIHGGVRYAAGFGGMMSDNNTLALALAMGVPLSWFARLLIPWKPARMGMALCTMLCVASIIFTHSRGGALASAAGLFMIFIRARRKLATALVLIMLTMPILLLVSTSYMDRLSTMADPLEESSAKSRVVLAQAAVKLWLDYPLFGVGFTEANEQKLIDRYVPEQYQPEFRSKVIHNTYLQLLVDSGIIALLIYCWLLVSTMWRLGRSARRVKQLCGVERAAIPYGLQASLVTYAVGSTFLSRTTFDFYYILVMCAAAWLEIEPKVGDVQGEPAQAVLAPMGMAAPAPTLPGVREPRTARERRGMLRGAPRRGE